MEYKELSEQDLQNAKEQYNRQIEAIKHQFETVAAKKDEESIHKFLISFNFLFDNIFSMNCAIFSKYHLAESYIPDFLILGNSIFRQTISPIMTFIEIERADFKLFTKKGDPSSHLSHAISQVQQWKKWLLTNYEHFRSKLMQKISINNEVEFLTKYLVHGFKAQFAVIIGRKNTLTTENRLLLEQMNNDYRDIQILTYDTLLKNHIILQDSDSIFRGRDEFGIPHS
ncbi:MAG: DUF4263 domain-containing protein, partial [Desulfobacteraceae bacterium]